MSSALAAFALMLQSFDSPAASQLVWGDYDGDRRLDALVIDAGGTARLLHYAGEGVFEDVSELIGLAAAGPIRVAAFGDFDRDGDEDLFVASPSDETALLRNDAGVFRAAGGLLLAAPADADLQIAGIAGAHWLDVDADGWLDLHLHGETGDVLYRSESGSAFAPVALSAPTFDAPASIGAGEIAPGVIDSIDGLPRDPNGRRPRPGSPWLPPRGSGSSPSVSAAPTYGATPVGPASPVSPAQWCPPGVTDVSTGNCVPAASVPALGKLYPLGPEFNIGATGNVGINTITPAYRLHVIEMAGTSVFAQGGTTGVRGDANLVGAGNRIGGDFTASGGSNNIGVKGSSTIGVYGVGTAYGALGETNSASSVGVFGRANHASGTTTGVLGEVASTSGTAVLGQATATTGSTIGVRGTTASSAGAGVRGEGPVTGVRGDANGTGGSGDRFGGHFTASGGSNNVGVYSFSTTGVQGVGTTYGARGSASSVGGIGVSGDATATSGNSIGVRGVTTSPTGAGVVGSNITIGTDAVGVLGTAGSLIVGANAVGVRGVITNPSGTSEGVGVEGTHNGTGIGVRGTTVGGTAVLGSATTVSGGAIGVHGKTAASDGIGVRGEVTNGGASGFAYGVEGIAPVRAIYGRATSTTSGSATGVTGITSSSNGTGVFGGYTGSAGAYGVRGVGRTGVEGVHVGVTGVEPGVRGETPSTDAEAAGVLGVLSGTSVGLDAAAVKGHNPSTGTSGYGVYGRHDGAGVGVHGRSWGGGTGGLFMGSTGAHGVGVSSTGEGIGGKFSAAASLTNVGVDAVGHWDEGTSYGVRARGTNDWNCYGGYFETSGIWEVPIEVAVYGENQYPGWTLNYAGYFVGDLHVTGTVNSNVKAFKIDHPLDPENKYLWHSSVESDEMKNIYDGIAVLDAVGSAWVELPEWFESLNGDFRYQLTCIGPWAPVSIGQKIADNRFQIVGGHAGQEVSWQVTGVRKDAAARAHRLPVEEAKLEHERGYYLDPEAYGLPRERGVHVAMKKLMQGESPAAAEQIRAERGARHAAQEAATEANETDDGR